MKATVVLILLISVSFAVDIQDLEKRAWTGDIQARYDLGFSFYRGKYHKKNYQSAFYWFNQNASAKHVASLYNVGIMYEAGDGLPQNLIQAQLYFLMAKELGDYDAEYRYEELNEKLNKLQKQSVLNLRNRFKVKSCFRDLSFYDNVDLAPIDHVFSKSLKAIAYKQNVVCPKP